MLTAILTPAYGRDYKNSKEAKIDFENGKDFVYHGYDGPYGYVNKEDLREGYKAVNIRYKKNTCVTVIKLV